VVEVVAEDEVGAAEGALGPQGEGDAVAVVEVVRVGEVGGCGGGGGEAWGVRVSFMWGRVFGGWAGLGWRGREG